MSKFFNKITDYISLIYCWVCITLMFISSTGFLENLSGISPYLIKKIIFIFTIILSLIYVLTSIMHFLALFSKKIYKYLEKDYDIVFLFFLFTLAILCFYIWMTIDTLKSPFREINLLLPFLFCLVYLFVNLFCYYKTKKNYPDEKIISINIANFHIFIIEIFILIPITLNFYFMIEKFSYIFYILSFIFFILYLISLLYCFFIILFPRVLTNKRVINYLYFYNKSKSVILLSDINNFKQVRRYDYEIKLNNGEKSYIRDFSRRKGKFIKKIMEAKEKSENIDKGEDI